MTQPLQQTIYSPKSELRHPGRLIHSMFQDLLRSRGLAWRLFVRNISAKYRQSLVGYIWAILPPLLVSALWIFLNSQKIISVASTTTPYPLYVLTGTLLWQIFVESINAPMRVVRGSASMIAKINFPREALIVTAFLEIIFHMSIQIVLLGVVLIYFKIPLQNISAFACLGLLGLISFGMMIGILLTPLSILFGDIQHGLPMILQPLFYLTPIVYSPPTSGFATVIAAINPITPLIRLTRGAITTGETACLHASITIFGATTLLLFIGWILYRIAMPHLIERISS